MALKLLSAKGRALLDYNRRVKDRSTVGQARSDIQ